MRIGITAARDQFCSLLKRVQRGQLVVITRHGKPVANLRGFPAAREHEMPVDVVSSITRSTDRLLQQIDGMILKRSTTKRRRRNGKPQ